ncbi:MAG: group III truncated hemoglobin [Pseudoruegeria sp.]
MLARFPITAAQIDDVVAEFYRRIRVHSELGPVFLGHVGADYAAWQAHESKIAAFWRNAILMERSYNGNPMRTHMDAGNVMAAHFTPWLALFDVVLAEQLPAETAESFSALAHRIGRGLRMGVEDLHKPAGAVPML